MEEHPQYNKHSESLSIDNTNTNNAKVDDKMCSCQQKIRTKFVPFPNNLTKEILCSCIQRA